MVSMLTPVAFDSAPIDSPSAAFMAGLSIAKKTS
jgi:hypothetical protein